MAWPPPVLPINRTNATPQIDTHAADHNALALAVNDTVGRLVYVGDEQANHSAAIQLIKNEHWIGGVDHTDGAVGFAIASASTVVTTNANGDFSINFLPMFSTAPIVICGGDAGSPNLIFTIVAVSTSTFSAHAIYANSDVAAPVGNVTIRVNWIALGQK